MCQMGEGENAGAVRKMLDYYGLDVECVPVDEAFRSINTDPETGFDVTMPVGVADFIDEMEKQVPGCRASLENVMELSRMLVDGVEWLSTYHNEPEGPAKIAMLLKWHDLMKLVPMTVDEMLRRIGVPDKAREIYESYWDYVSADSTRMSFAVYAFMVYTYLTKKPWIARLRSHEISLAFDRRIRELGGEIWYNTEVARIEIKDNCVQGVTLANGTLTIRSTGDAKFGYRVLKSASLAAPITWEPLDETYQGGVDAGQSFELPVDPAEPQMFYKVEVLKKR